LACSTVLGQYGSVGQRGLHSSGSAQFDVEPSRIKLVMWIEAQELDAKTAVQVLMQHRDKVRGELKQLMVIEDSVKFSTMQVEESSDDEEHQEMVGRLRMMGQGDQDIDDTEVPKTFTAYCALKAEWEIPAAREEQIAILPATLKEQVAKRDLAGKSNQPKLDSEIAQRINKIKKMVEEQMGAYYGGGSDGERVPQIYFVGSYTDEQLATATKEAIQKAKKRANLLATAAGAELGGLMAISTTMGDFDYYDDYSYGYDYDVREFPTKFMAPKDNEVQSSSMDSLSHEVDVYLTFDISFAK
jgi:hypothetical protein